MGEMKRTSASAAKEMHQKMTFHNRVVVVGSVCESISADLIWNSYLRRQAASRWWLHCKRAALQLSGIVDVSRAE